MKERTRTRHVKLKRGKSPAFIDRLSGRRDKDVISITSSNDKTSIYSAWICACSNTYQCYISNLLSAAGSAIADHSKSIATQLNRLSEIDRLLTVLNENLKCNTDANKHVIERKNEEWQKDIAELKAERGELEEKTNVIRIEIDEITHRAFQAAIEAKTVTLGRIANYARGAKLKIMKHPVDCSLPDYKCCESYAGFRAYLIKFTKGEAHEII